MQITLDVNHGRLTLGTTAGLSFTTGDGTQDPALTFTGKITDINTALSTLEYRADVHYNGLDSLNVSVDDLGNSGSGGAQVDSRSVEITVLSVNDAPQLTLPASLSVNEDTSLAVLGLAVSDVDADTADMQITLDVNHGRLTLGTTAGLSFTTGDGIQDPALTFTGTPADIHAALATLQYQADLDYYGPDALNVVVSDLGHSGSGGALIDSGRVDLTILSINDTPTTTGLTDIKVDEDAPITRADLFAAFDDVEQQDNALKYTILDVTNPSLFKNVFVDSTNGWLVIRYATNMHGDSEITVRVVDAEGLFVDDTLNVTVNSVNDKPVSAPNSFSMRGDEVLVLDAPGILANDADVDGDKLSAILVRPPLHGKLVLNPDGSLRYEPDPSFVGIDSFAYAASDGQAASDRTQVAIKIAAPTSPVDPNSQTPGNNLPPNTPTPAISSEISSNLQTLLSSEAPNTAALNVQTQPTAARAHQQVDKNLESGIDPLTTTVGQLSHSNFGDDAAGNRNVLRARSSDDTLEAEIAPAEMVVVPNVPEWLTPVTAGLQNELASVETILEDSDLFHRWMVGSAVGLTTGLTVGYVFWTVRAGYLLTGLIAQMPAWRFVDPLPILNSLSGDAGPSDGESLESILQAGHGEATRLV
jgi:hypothetical protein